MINLPPTQNTEDDDSDEEVHGARGVHSPPSDPGPATADVPREEPSSGEVPHSSDPTVEAAEVELAAIQPHLSEEGEPETAEEASTL